MERIERGDCLRRVLLFGGMILWIFVCLFGIIMFRSMSARAETDNMALVCDFLEFAANQELVCPAPMSGEIKILEPEIKTSVWFTNPYFVGNSLMEGLEIVCPDDYGFCTKTGASIPDLSRMIDCPADADCVIIEVGTNEMGFYSQSEFVDMYVDFIESFELPCFCVSIPPCNESKSKYASWVSNNNISAYNDCILEACRRTGSVFIDCSALFGDSLPDSWTGDGLHLSASVYSAWYDLIIDTVCGRDWSRVF